MKQFKKHLGIGGKKRRKKNACAKKDGERKKQRKKNEWRKKGRKEEKQENKNY